MPEFREVLGQGQDPLMLPGRRPQGGVPGGSPIERRGLQPRRGAEGGPILDRPALQAAWQLPGKYWNAFLLPAMELAWPPAEPGPASRFIRPRKSPARSHRRRCRTRPPRCSAPSSTRPSTAPTGPSSRSSTASASSPASTAGDLTLLSRNNKPQEARFPEIAEGLRPALRRPAIIDGEVVCLDESGKTSFRELQQRFHLDDAAEIRRRMEQHPAYLYLFDVLYLDRLRRDPPAALATPGAAPRGRRLVRPDPPAPTPCPARGSRPGSGPARRARRGSSASGSTAATSRAGATPG